MSDQAGSAVRVAAPASEPETRPGRPNRAERRGILIGEQTWRGIAWTLFWIAVAGVVGVILGEIDRLIASVPADGRSHSLNVVLSPLALAHTDSWGAWARADLHGRLGFWISLSAVIDFFLALALFQLFARLVRTVGGRARRVPGAAVFVYACAELTENALQFVAGLVIADGASGIFDWLAAPIAIATTVKALSILTLFVALARIPEYRLPLLHRLRRVFEAVWVHRLATLAILVIVVLACIPAADLLDQLPDVQRQWADGWRGAMHAGFAVLVLIGTATGTFALGRRRTKLLVETRVMGLERLPARSRIDAAWPWIIAPALLLVVGGVTVAVSLAAGLPFPVHLPTAVALIVFNALIPIFAACDWKKDAVERRLEPDPPRARYAWYVGDALGVLVLVAGGIGVVRSYVVPALLSGQTPDAWTNIWSFGMLVLAAGTAIGAPLLLPRLGRTRFGKPYLDPNARMSGTAPRTDRDPDDRYVSPAGPVEVGAIVIGVLFLGVFMVVPVVVGWWLGAVAVALVAISAWSAVLGSFTLLVQPRALVAPFTWLRLNAPPVLTLAILVPFAFNLVWSVYWPDRIVHAVHVSESDGRGARTPDRLVEHLEALQADVECAVRVPGADPVRPVFLIAAEGGGIRAAYWTTSTLAALSGCGARSGYVASGISGGSVGLAIATSIDARSAAASEAGSEAGSPASPADRAARDARDLQASVEIMSAAEGTSGPDVVSSALLGLAVGDVFAGGTGIRVPSVSPDFDGDDPGLRWRDRAAIVEALWERDAPALADSFSDRIDARTGMLMLNSADVVTKCRLLVDQVPVTDREPKGACDTVGGLPSMLGFRELPATSPDRLADCLASLDWSTAAMLSARFAIITPTGGMPGTEPCTRPKGAQFVDGGYVEPTSLAALADTAPELMALLADANEERAAGEPWLVPVLVYLRNTQGYDLAKDVARAESESLVPITGSAARTNLTAEDSWLQRIVLSLPSACPDGRAAQACHASLDGFIGRGGVLEGGTVVVAPASTPAVVPPLGWALSNLSRARFTSAIATAAGCHVVDGRVVRDASNDADAPPVETADGGEAPPDASAGYPGLAKLGEVMRFDPCATIQAQRDASRGAPSLPEG